MAPQTLVRPEILTSWTRSHAAITPDVAEAPLADESETASMWHDSPLQRGVENVESELRRTAEDGDLVIAVTDADTRILWTYGGRVMRRKAETVNFVASARWDDESVGTNALDLANRLGEPSMVFSAEHYASMVHNWVCWAAPVHDPTTGVQLGVIDLSTTWDRTHPIGLATARVMARLIESALPRSSYHPSALLDETHDPGLVLTLLGTAEARLDGRRLLLNRRQTEVLALLALQPRRPLAGAAARVPLRRRGGHLLHAEGRGLPPPACPRRPALLAPLPSADAGRDRRRAGPRPPAPGDV